MTIKKRIFYTNTFMVLAALFILLAIAGTTLIFLKDEFVKWYGESSELSEAHYEVYEKIPELTLNDTDWERWSKELAPYDFRLYVTDENGKRVYSNLRHSEMEGVESLFSVQKETGEIHTFFVEKVTVFSTKIETSGGTYEVYIADCPAGTSFLGIDGGVFELFLIAFLVIGILSIIGILICSQLFTKALIKKILHPVNQLDIAAQRVTEGNLDVPVAYQQEDEFKNLCDSFDMMQEHLKTEMERNAAYEKARTEMVSGISHDLRTPLTSIKGYIKGMIDGVAATEEKRKEYLTIAYKKSCDMDRLLMTLFYFSKLETGNMPFYMQKTQIEEYIGNYAKEKEAELSQKGATINVSTKTDEKLFCNIDKEQIQRVLDNLIENSCKYANRGNNLVLGFELLEGWDEITIDYYDNGEGVPEDKLDTIFEQFYREDESRNSEGNGLGLYVCRFIIKEHGGTIRAYNKDGFHIEITLPKWKDYSQEFSPVSN